jgi:putative ABC transport system permease protein
VFKATLKSIRGHKGRVIATAAAVILGVSFLAGTLIFTDSVRRAFDDLFATVFETTDAAVRSTETIDVGFGLELRSRMDDSVVDTVAAVDGVAAVDPFVQGSATVIDADGDPIGNPAQGPPTLGFSWTEDDALNQFTVTEGRGPTGPGEVVLDENTASVGDLAVGDQVQILTTSGSDTYELVGVARFGTSGSLAGATTAMFTLDEAQRVMGAEGRLDGVSVRADEGLSEQEVVDRVEAALEASGLADVEVITGTEATEETQDAVAEGLSFFNTFLIAFAVIALFVSVFVIFNTFSILVAQRTREFALLRALGAARRQVVGSVFVEAIVVGLGGSVLGIGLGVALSFGLRGMLQGLGIDLPSGGLVVLPRTFVVALIVGVLVTVVAALVPAVRASQVAPVEAMRESQAEPWHRNNVRFAIGLAVALLGAIAIFYGLLAPEILFAGLGAGVMFIGVFILGPSIARPVARWLGAPIAALRGATGKLARENSMRNPKRTARTAAALTVGVALVAGVTVLASSLSASIEDTIAQQFVGDFTIDAGSGGGFGGGFSPRLTEELDALPEVETAAGVRVGLGEIEGDGDFFSVVDPAAAFQLFDIGLIEGSPETMTDDAIFLLDDRAADLGVGMGDQVSVRFPDGVDRELTVRGLYTEPALAGNQAISVGLYESTGAEQLDLASFVLLADGVSVEEARSAIAAVTDAYPNVEVQDRSEYIENQTAGLDQVLGLIYGLLGLAIVIAAFGIANTLRLSTIERTREIGLLRAVGMTRSQVQSTIRWEAVITALFGAALGVVLGLFFGYAIIYALRDQGVSSFDVPVIQLAIVVVLAALVGLVSSIVPSIRASRLNILQAIATE